MSKYHPVGSNKIARLASAFGVDESILQVAFQKFHDRQANRGPAVDSADAVVTRFEKVRAGLETELGGEKVVREWLQMKNAALGDHRPIDLLADGRVDVLERVHEALKTSQFS